MPRYHECFSEVECALNSSSMALLSSW